LIFDPAQLEPVSPGLTHQPTYKGLDKFFFIKLGFTFGSC